MAEEEFEESEDKGTERSRRWSEGPWSEAFRKALEKGIEAGVVTLQTANEALRGVTQDGGKIPKELIGYLFSQVDETKNALVRGVAREVRDFLEATDIAGEVYRALTSLSFEIKTEIRFIPNEAGGVRPQVKARAVPKRTRRGRGKQETKSEADPQDSSEPSGKR